MKKKYECVSEFGKTKGKKYKKHHFTKHFCVCFLCDSTAKECSRCDAVKE